MKLRQREVVRALLAPGLESWAVVVSCNESNALRTVLTLCQLIDDADGKLRGLPTTVGVPASANPLNRPLLAIASPYTVPQNCVVAREGSLGLPSYESLETALKRVLGWAAWP